MRDFPVKERLAQLDRIQDKESYSEWFNDLASSQLGDKWPEIARNMNVPNTVNIRVNTLKASPEEVLEELETHHIEVHPHPVFEMLFTSKDVLD